VPRLDTVHLGLALALSGILAWAAVSDIATRRIPNASVVCVIALYGLWVLAAVGAGLGSALLAAAIGFAVGYALYLFKIMGAGDVKLFAATALFMGLSYLPLFALATVLAGGVMAAVSLASRPRRAMAMLILRGKGDFGRGIPYGVAIGFGGALVLWAALCGALPADILLSLRQG
jgi:prepilin peptidase CpaA